MQEAGKAASRIGAGLPAAVSVLVAVRFFSAIGVASVALPSDTFAVLGQVLDAYGILIALGISSAVVLLLVGDRSRVGRPIRLTAACVQILALATWIFALSSFAPPDAKTAFPLIAAVAVTAIALVAFLDLPPRIRSLDEPMAWAYWAFLGAVPLAFALRIAVFLGLGTSPGPGGVTQGNWYLVNVPTFLLESLVVGAWLGMVWDLGGKGPKRRWLAFSPFAVFLVAVYGLLADPLFPFVFSAVVTWGTNLAVFVPTTVSLTLVAATLACYASFFLFLRQAGDRMPWKQLLLGTLVTVFAGFFPAMPSASGLSFGILTVARATRAPRARREPRPDAPTSGSAKS